MTGGFSVRTVLAAALTVVGFTLPAHAVIVGSDDAGNYTTWNSGDNGGTGFDVWSFVGSGVHGYFLGSSTGLSSPGANINSGGGTSFGMYGEGGGGFADAGRNFSSPLTVGGTFSLDLAVNFRNGNKGIDLRNGSGSTIFNFNVGGDDHVVTAATGGGSIGNAYSDNTAFRLTFTQTSLSGGAWTIARSGGVTDFDSGTYSGLAAGFKLYTAGTGGGSPNNLMANNLVITAAVPEASALLFGGLVCLVAGSQAWRRSRRPRR
jgi:hypothetical protein